MAFTMHSHSGQFCPGHAQDELENIIRHAITIGYKTIGLTEHMPRYEERDLYPEEVSCGQARVRGHAQFIHVYTHSLPTTIILLHEFAY